MYLSQHKQVNNYWRYGSHHHEYKKSFDADTHTLFFYVTFLQTVYSTLYIVQPIYILFLLEIEPYRTYILKLTTLASLIFA